MKFWKPTAGGRARGIFQPRPGHQRRAFTLIEAMIAIALIGLAASATFAAIGKLNEYASISRLYTSAETVAQNQIDRILSDSPFNPSWNPPQIPASLVPDSQRGGPLVQNQVPIYTDPATGEVSVMGTVTTSVVDTGTSLNGSSLNVYRATVTVNYQFRNRKFAVVMSTLRTSDI
jgi:prepilin-type N-terminal cleavage/methylation domain-containing protein